MSNEVEELLKTVKKVEIQYGYLCEFLIALETKAFKQESNQKVYMQ